MLLLKLLVLVVAVILDMSAILGKKKKTGTSGRWIRAGVQVKR